jgi:hypothetical protein
VNLTARYLIRRQYEIGYGQIKGRPTHTLVLKDKITRKVIYHDHVISYILDIDIDDYREVITTNMDKEGNSIRIDHSRVDGCTYYKHESEVETARDNLRIYLSVKSLQIRGDK